ncbi:hypothetical protein [Hymenobacter rubripertinctus]|uniref:DUF3575 domain-containing protein n=1 Tax=Hymenobacter rubripertinctus TaxID=2029981 RepID=A0A418QRS7_9BACT|nr:hypothetical protein [Hymenobacter rubripertinctus]RIY07801.1 hypothetical protein D0T11_15610 [Hymenobacter rubripertinctus]
MIRNPLRILRPGCLLAAALLFNAALARPASAQTTPTTESAAPVGFRHAVRLDLGGVLARNMAYNLLNNEPQVLLPILVGYEQQLGRRTSGSVEVLLNGGEPDERLKGLALQGRYYFYQRRPTGLAGFYVAPTLSYRAVQLSPYYGPTIEKRQLGGAGMLLGAQVPLGRQRRFLLDVAAGSMSWTRLSPERPSNSGSYYYQETYYENNSAVFDGRLSLGYRF